MSRRLHGWSNAQFLPSRALYFAVWLRPSPCCTCATVSIERQQAEFSKACTALITNANAPDLIRKVLEQRDTILQMDKTDGENN